ARRAPGRDRDPGPEPVLRLPPARAGRPPAGGRVGRAGHRRRGAPAARGRARPRGRRARARGGAARGGRARAPRPRGPPPRPAAPEAGGVGARARLTRQEEVAATARRRRPATAPRPPRAVL